MFDQFAPSAEAERIVYRALVDLRATGGAVLVIPGNHDNREALRRDRAALRRGRHPRRSGGPPPAGRRDRGGPVPRRQTGRAGRSAAVGAGEGAVRRRGDDGTGGGPEQGLRRRAAATADGAVLDVRAREDPRAGGPRIRRRVARRRRRARTDGGRPVRDRATATAEDAAVHRPRTRPPPAGHRRGRRARLATPARCCSSTSASANRTRT